MKKILLFIFASAYILASDNTNLDKYIQEAEHAYKNQEYKKAFKLSKKLCEKNNVGSSCFILGKIYENGNGGVSKSFFKATESYQKACDLENSDGCYVAGLLHEQNKQTELSNIYYIKACEKNKHWRATSLERHILVGLERKKTFFLLLIFIKNLVI